MLCFSRPTRLWWSSLSAFWAHMTLASNTLRFGPYNSSSGVIQTLPHITKAMCSYYSFLAIVDSTRNELKTRSRNLSPLVKALLSSEDVEIRQLADRVLKEMGPLLL